MTYELVTQQIKGTYVVLAQHVADVLRACPHFPDDFRADGARVADVVATCFGEIFPTEVLASNEELSVWFVVTDATDSRNSNSGDAPGWFIERHSHTSVVAFAGTNFDAPFEVYSA